MVRSFQEAVFEVYTKTLKFLNDLKDSKNIVEIIDSEVKSSGVAVVMEHCIFDLATEGAIKGFHPNRVIYEILLFLLDVEKQMRAENIVNFDLKPKNILKRGWKVTDFDTSAYVEDGQTLYVSRRGTLGYTDPDVFKGITLKATSMTDLYSVGAILHTGDGGNI